MDWIFQLNSVYFGLCNPNKGEAMRTLPTVETYNELQTAYDFFNTRLFDGGLPPLSNYPSTRKNALTAISAASVSSAVKAGRWLMKSQWILLTLQSEVLKKPFQHWFMKWLICGNSITASQGGAATIIKNGAQRWIQSGFALVTLARKEENEPEKECRITL